MTAALNNHQQAPATGAHSPLPWSLAPGFNGEAVLSANEMMVADCGVWHFARPVKDNRANAAYIVRACNAHDDLVKALRLAERAIDDCQNYRSHLHHEELAAVRAALAKATGGTP